VASSWFILQFIKQLDKIQDRKLNYFVVAATVNCIQRHNEGEKICKKPTVAQNVRKLVKYGGHESRKA